MKLTRSNITAILGLTVLAIALLFLNDNLKWVGFGFSSGCFLGALLLRNQDDSHD